METAAADIQYPLFKYVGLDSAMSRSRKNLSQMSQL